MRKRRNSTLDSQYINNISQLTNLTEEEVESVFTFYKLLLLNDIATCADGGGNITITLPCFTTLRLKPCERKDGTQYLSVGIDRLVKKDRLSCLEEAYFNHKNYLVEYLSKQFSEKIKESLLQHMEESE